MNRSTAIVVALCIAVAAGTAQADVVSDWNQAADDVMNAAKAVGAPRARAYAMVHVAMSDAINSVQAKYTRYVAGVSLMPQASPEVAAAAAARQILTQLFPKGKAIVDEAYAASIKGVPEGPAKSEGIALGERIAAAIQTDRASDGTTVPDTYRPLTSPGVWVPTTLPSTPQYAYAKPWVMKSADQFRPGPPPALSSALYARDYNETKTLGGATSIARTLQQTEAVRFWSGTANLFAGLQAAARQLAAAKGLGLAENARLFALLNMGIANSVIADWDAKFAYNFWRPITGIRNGDMDSNDATERDPSWTPFEATPIHPEYPSQAAIQAGAALGILEAVFGPNPAEPVSATDVADPKRKRQFRNVAEMLEEHKDVRIWGGIHFRNSLHVGFNMGRKIAAYLVDN